MRLGLEERVRIGLRLGLVGARVRIRNGFRVSARARLRVRDRVSVKVN